MNKTKGSAGRILVVDDAPDNLRLLMALLKNAGFEVLTAADGETALGLVSDGCPDLVLLDVLLPDLNGYDVCRQLKNNPQTAETPVIFISGLDESIEKLQAFDAGGVDYICKPFHSEEVLARIETHLKLRYALQTVQDQKMPLNEKSLNEKKLNGNSASINIRWQECCPGNYYIQKFSENCY